MALRVKLELQRRRNTRYGASVSNTEMSALQRRARAIWGFSGMQQGALAEAAGIEAARLKRWMGSRPAKPELHELLKLAEAAEVPRQFAERGFDGLLEPDEQLAQEVERLRSEVSQLRGRLEREQLDTAERVLEVERRLDAIEKRDQAQSQRQP